MNITLLSGRAAPWSGQFDKDEISVGRAKDADVCLHPDDRLCASGVHARLLRRDERWFIAVDHDNGVTWKPDRGDRSLLRKNEEAEIAADGELTVGRNGPRLRVSIGKPAAEDSDVPEITVRILSGFNSPWSQSFNQSEITIGRCNEADVRLHPLRDTGCASGIHARLLRKGETWFLEACHRSGLLLHTPEGNTRRLEDKSRAVLRGELECTLGRNGPRLRITLPVTVEGPLPVTCIDGGASCSNVVGGVVIDDIVHRSEKTMQRRVNRVAMASVAAVLVVSALGWSFYPSVDPTTALNHSLTQAQESVYLVGGVRDGTLQPSGTAWAVAKGTLATNAHVADALQSLRDQGLRLVARLPGNPPKDLPITNLTIHPGWSRFQPLAYAVQQTARGAERGLTSFDVAVLHVSGDAGELLPLATDKEVHALRSGTAVGYVGFPMENMGGLQGNQPPTVAPGTITAIQDALGQTAPPRYSIILQHNIPCTGGSSGSPLINADGRVVGLNNAMHGISVPSESHGGQRFKHISVGLNYGQRVDLLRELLEDRSTANLADHEEYLMRAVDGAGVTAAQIVWASTIAHFSRWIRTGEIPDEPRWSSILNVAETIGTGGLVRTVSTQRRHRYVIAACAQDFSLVRIELLGRTSVEATEEGRFPALRYVSAGSGEFRVRVSPLGVTDKQVRVVLAVHEVENAR